MKLKDLFKKEMPDLDLDLETKPPKIIFKSKELENRIIDWLENDKTFQKEFGMILVEMGVSPDDFVVLDNYDEKSLSFGFCLSSTYTNIDDRIFLRYGEGFDSYPEIIICTDKYDKDYEYISNEKPGSKVQLNWYGLKNKNNYLYCPLYRDNCLMKLNNGENAGSYNFSVSIDNQDGGNVTDLSKKSYFPKPEDKLNQYLLNLSFPIDIVEVYKKIVELLPSPVAEYSKFILKVEKILSKDRSQVTDLIHLNAGELSQFTITKNEKTISIDSNNYWSYYDQGIFVQQDDAGMVDYRLKRIPRSEMASMTSPADEVNRISREVDEVVALAKTLKR